MKATLFGSWQSGRSYPIKGGKMVYTKEDAKREVGDSTDLIVGLEASIKKWEIIVADEKEGKPWERRTYTQGDSCGVCFVVHNIRHSEGVCKWCHERFGTSHEPGNCHFMEVGGSEAILQHLKDTLQHERWHLGWKRYVGE